MKGKNRLMVIVNPRSGAASRHNAAQKVSHLAEEIGYDVDLRLTEYAGHATGLAREAVAAGYYGVLACGGDGTVNEVARGLCGSPVIMGIIPLGSGNGLARHLGVPITVEGAMKVVAENRILESDYATANGRPFFCTFGVGFDALVTDKFNKLPGRGLKNYLRTTIEEFVGYKPERYTIIANGKILTEEAVLVACCNASQYGNNAYIAPHASIKDGLLDVTVIHGGNLFETASAGIEIVTGMIGKSAKTMTFRTRELTIIRTTTGPAHFDGEPANMPDRIEIVCHHAALRVFSTERKQRLRAIMAPEIPILSPLALTIRDLRFRIYNLFT